MAGKNSQIHLILETDLKVKLVKEATESNITLSELCRQKLGSNPQLTKIEFILERIEKKIK